MKQMGIGLGARRNRNEKLTLPYLTILATKINAPRPTAPLLAAAHKLFAHFEGGFGELEDGQR